MSASCPAVTVSSASACIADRVAPCFFPPNLPHNFILPPIAMKFASYIATATLTALCLTAPVLAQERGTKEEAKTLVDSAWEHVKKVGNEKAFKDFTTDKATWSKKDLYVMAADFKGVTLAHGANEKLVGKEMLGVKDANGVAFMAKMIDAAKSPAGTGWVDYDWPHPQTKKIEGKSSYVRKLPSGDGFVGVGVYR